MHFEPDWALTQPHGYSLQYRQALLINRYASHTISLISSYSMSLHPFYPIVQLKQRTHQVIKLWNIGISVEEVLFPCVGISPGFKDEDVSTSGFL
jgi:hypothetical protein